MIHFFRSDFLRRSIDYKNHVSNYNIESQGRKCSSSTSFSNQYLSSSWIGRNAQDEFRSKRHDEDVSRIRSTRALLFIDRSSRLVSGAGDIKITKDGNTLLHEMVRRNLRFVRLFDRRLIFIASSTSDSFVDCSCSDCSG